MCARYELDGTYKDIADNFDITGNAKMNHDFAGKEEVRPTDYVPVIIDDKLIMLSWGLSNDWSKQPIINARSETVIKKPTFQPLTENRCLVPATAYFEWGKTGNAKIKTHIQPRHGKMITFAGLFRKDQFTILTCEPFETIAHIHSRMPVIIPKENEAKWLSRDKSFHNVADILKPRKEIQFEINTMERKPVKTSTQMNLF